MQVTENFKIAIILDANLPIGLKANTAAVLSLTLGNKIEGLIGRDVYDASGSLHEALTQYPLPILSATEDKLQEIYHQAIILRDTLLVVDLTDIAQTTHNYDEYEEKMKNQNIGTLQFRGIALAGDKKLVNKFTGNLALLR